MNEFLALKITCMYEIIKFDNSVAIISFLHIISLGNIESMHKIYVQSSQHLVRNINTDVLGLFCQKI